MRSPTACTEWFLILTVVGVNINTTLATDEASVSTETTPGVGYYVVQGLGGSSQTTSTSVTTADALNMSASSGAFATNSANSSAHTHSSSPRSFSNGTITAKATSTQSTYVSAVNTSSANATIRTSCAYTDVDCQNTCNSYTSSCANAYSIWESQSQSWASTYWPTDSSGYSFQTDYLTESGSTHTYTYWDLLSTPYTTVTSADTYTGVDISYIGETLLYTSFTKDFTENVETEAGTWTYALGETTVSTSTVVESYVESVYTQVLTSYAFTIPEPSCTQQMACTMGPDPVCDSSDQCTIYGGTVQLLYWPVATATASSNATLANATMTNPTFTNSTALSSPDTPVVAVYQGTTLTSPSVYISFATIYAENRCNTTVGGTHTGSILGMLPADLSSALGNIHALETLSADSSTTALSMYAASFDIADLNWPYNPYGWDEQLRCRDYIAMTCPVIVSGEYRPIIVVPTAIRNLDPAWASCALDWQGLYDPPTALTPASVVASPTLYAGTSSQSTSAVPSPTGDSPTPSPTTAPTAGASSSVAASTSTVASASQTQPSAESETVSESESSSQETETQHQPSSQDAQSQTDTQVQPSSGSPKPAATTSVSTQVNTERSSDPQATSQPPASSQGDSSATAVDPAFTGSAGADPGSADVPSTSIASHVSTEVGTGSLSDPQTSSQALSSSQVDPAVTSGQAGSSGDPTPTVLGTVGSGSHAVTLVSDPTQSGQMIATSDRGATTLKPGDTGALNGQSFSVGSSGDVGIASLSTISLGSGLSGDPTSIATVAAQSGDPDQVVSVGDTVATLQPGKATTVSGESGYVTVSAITSGAVVLLSQGSVSTLQTTPSAYAVGGQSQVLTAGGPAVTVSGTVYSVPRSGDGVVVSADGTESTIIPTADNPSSLDPGVVGIAPSTDTEPASNAPVATVNSLAVAKASNGIVMDGNTITYGSSPTTIAGAVYSLASNGDVVFWSETTFNQQQGSFATVVDAAVSAAKAQATASTAEQSASSTATGDSVTGTSSGDSSAFKTGPSASSTSATRSSETQLNSVDGGGGNTASSSSAGVQNGACVTRSRWALSALIPAIFGMLLAFGVVR